MFQRIFDISENVAIVTGCSGGLGVQMANALANEGCKIVAIARRLDKLQEVCKKISDKYEVETLPLQCDITNTERVEETVKEALDHFGRIDILVNNWQGRCASE